MVIRVIYDNVVFEIEIEETAKSFTVKKKKKKKFKERYIYMDMNMIIQRVSSLTQYKLYMEQKFIGFKTSIDHPLHGLIRQLVHKVLLVGNLMVLVFRYYIS